MKHQQDPAIVISPYQHVAELLRMRVASRVISILGKSDELEWPEAACEVLRVQFDDVVYSSGRLVAPSREQIAELIEFSRCWNGNGTLMVHCKAGSSRSPAAAMIAAAALGRPDSKSLVMRVATGKAYFRANQKMLMHADSLLCPSPGLVDLARSMPLPTRTDTWGPISIPLTHQSF